MYNPKMKLRKGLKSLGKTLGVSIKRLTEYNPGIETSGTLQEYSDSPIAVSPYNQSGLHQLDANKARASQALEGLRKRL